MNITNQQAGIGDNLDFFAKQVVEGFLTGIHKSPYHGFSVEFAEHRLYNPGESVKDIDWKLFARSDRLFTKKFEEETNLRAYVMVDTSSSMQYPLQTSKSNEMTKLSFSLYSTACLFYLFQKQRDGFGLTFYSDQLDLFTDSKVSKLHYNRLMLELDKMLSKKDLKNNKATNFPQAISSFIEKIPQRSLVIIFSDMLNFDNSSFDEVVDAIRTLKYRKNEVILFHVQDLDHESMFNFSNSPFQFVDLENKRQVKLNPSNYKELYRKRYHEFQKNISLACQKHKIDYVPAFIQDGFSKVLLSYLTKRSKLF